MYSLLELAAQAHFDPEVKPVLADAILEQEWYDDRCIDLLAPTTYRGSPVNIRRDAFRRAVAGEPVRTRLGMELKKRYDKDNGIDWGPKGMRSVAVLMREVWPRAVFAVLLFEGFSLVDQTRMRVDAHGRPIHDIRPEHWPACARAFITYSNLNEYLKRLYPDDRIPSYLTDQNPLFVGLNRDLEAQRLAGHRLVIDDPERQADREAWYRNQIEEMRLRAQREAYARFTINRLPDVNMDAASLIFRHDDAIDSTAIALSNLRNNKPR